MEDDFATRDFRVYEGFIERHLVVNQPGLAISRDSSGWRFDHYCTRVNDYPEPVEGGMLIAPNLGHTVTVVEGAVTVSPSILCKGCGVHGFVRSSVWVQSSGATPIQRDLPDM